MILTYCVITRLIKKFSHMIKIGIFTLILIINIAPGFSYEAPKASREKHKSTIVLMEAGAGQFAQAKGKIFLNIKNVQPNALWLSDSSLKHTHYTSTKDVIKIWHQMFQCSSANALITYKSQVYKSNEGHNKYLVKESYLFQRILLTLNYPILKSDGILQFSVMPLGPESEQAIRDDHQLLELSIVIYSTDQNNKATEMVRNSSRSEYRNMPLDNNRAATDDSEYTKANNMLNQFALANGDLIKACLSTLANAIRDKNDNTPNQKNIVPPSIPLGSSAQQVPSQFNDVYPQGGTANSNPNRYINNLNIPSPSAIRKNNKSIDTQDRITYVTVSTTNDKDGSQKHMRFE